MDTKEVTRHRINCSKLVLYRRTNWYYIDVQTGTISTCKLVLYRRASTISSCKLVLYRRINIHGLDHWVKNWRTPSKY